MAAKRGNASIKDEDVYNALREEGASKEKAARIANAKANPEMHPSAKGGRAAPYEEWTRKALYDRAREIGIEGRSRMRKQALIKALRNH